MSEIERGALEKLDQGKAAVEFQRPTGQSLSPLVQAAMSGNLDTERLKELLAIQREWEKGEAEKAFHAALADFKKEPLTIYKNKQVRFKNKSGGLTEYKHATLGAALESINPLLGKYGLSLSWETPEQKDTVITVICRLSHAGGFSKTTSLSAYPDDSGGKNSIQAVGSTVSYLERYTAFSLLGIASADQDDDGKGSDAKQEQETPEPPEGYAEWEADIIAVADEGIEALEKTFKASKIEFRKYLTANKPDEWAALKNKARGNQ